MKHLRRSIRIFLVSVALLGCLLSLVTYQIHRNQLQRHLNGLLLAAIKRDDSNTAIRLLKQSADPNARDERPHPLSLWQQLLLLGPVRNRPQSTAPRALLLALDPQAHVPPHPPNTAYISHWQPNPTLIYALLDHGAAVNVRDKDGNTPLRFAAGLCDVGIVKALLNRGAQVNVSDIGGVTPLLVSIGYNKGVTQVLLDHGAQVNVQDVEGASPLLMAAESGDAAMVQELLKRGAQIHKDMFGNTPLLYAAGRGDATMVKALLENGAQVNEGYPSPLVMAAQSGSIQVVKILLDKGAQVNFRDNSGQTALDWAIGNGDTKMVRLLKRYGAKK